MLLKTGLNLDISFVMVEYVRNVHIGWAVEGCIGGHVEITNISNRVCVHVENNTNIGPKSFGWKIHLLYTDVTDNGHYSGL